MNCNVQTFNSIPPQQLSGYFDAFVHNTQSTHNQNSWMGTLLCLRQQRWYLEGQLSRTVTVLNALRDSQTRNERALNTNPRPRSKKKKILQLRWRTDKTIKTRENEEKVILDCLQVCINNINTLESIMQPLDTLSTTAEYNSSSSYLETESSNTEFDWNGWGDDESTPFHRGCSKSLVVDEIPPDESAADCTAEPDRLAIKPPPLSLRDDCGISPSAVLPDAPPNTALTQFLHSTLSPEAACFEPSIAPDPISQDQGSAQVDKLTISGLLASKRVQWMQRRRFSDAAIGRILSRFMDDARQSVGGRQHSWAPGTEDYRDLDANGNPRGAMLHRTNTV